MKTHLLRGIYILVGFLFGGTQVIAKDAEDTFKYLFAGAMALNSPPPYDLAHNYLERVDNNKPSGMLKFYANICWALYYKKRFPEAKHLPRKERVLIESLEYLSNAYRTDQLSLSDIFLKDILLEWINEPIYSISQKDYEHFNRIILNEKPNQFNTLKMLLIRHLIDENDNQTLLQSIWLTGEYTNSLNSNNGILKARSYANYAAASKKLAKIDRWGEAARVHFRRSLNYYYREILAYNDSTYIPFQSPEMFIVEQELDKLATKNPPPCPNTPWAAIEIGASGVKFSVICLRTDNRVLYPKIIVR